MKILKVIPNTRQFGVLDIDGGIQRFQADKKNELKINESESGLFEKHFSNDNSKFIVVIDRNTMPDPTFCLVIESKEDVFEDKKFQADVLNRFGSEDMVNIESLKNIDSKYFSSIYGK